MAIRTNGFYNSPAFAQAAANLSAMFAPPSGADAAGWATANAKRDEAGRLAEQFKYLTDPTNQSADDYQRRADGYLMGTGSISPLQSFFKVRQDDATERRGQDIAASTSRANNAADNQRIAIVGLNGPLNPGQVQPSIDDQIMSALGLPGMAERRGAPKPMSETEWQASQNQRLVDSGQMSDQMLLDTILGKETPVQTVGPNGPEFMSPGEAVRTGAQPYDPKNAPKPPVAAVNAQNDVVIQDIDRALDSLGMLTTGLGAQITGGVAGTPAHDLDALLSTVRSNVGFDKLQRMREASPTGGALGAVSDRENAMLQSVLGNLSTTQSQGQLRQNLERVRDVYLDIIHGPGNRPQADVSPSAAPFAQSISDGTVIENDRGERMMLRNGQWEPL